MESNHKAYAIDESVARLAEILNNSDTSFEELNSIPSRDKLSYKNGFYVYCSCIFMDIRQSSKLTEKYKRPTLAKIYRCYISEAVAVINSSNNATWTDREVMVSDVFFENLNDDNKKLLERNSTRYCYHGNVVNIAMNEWVEENSK